MKKIISIMLVALLVASSAFAVSGYLGASTGYGFAFQNEPEVRNTSTYFPVSVDGATYFGDGDFGMGFSYGAEIVNFPFQKIISDNVKQDLKPLENYKWTLAPYAGLGFKYDFSKNVGIAGSVNATLHWDTVERTVLGEKVQGNYWELGMMGNLFFNMNLGPINFRIGGLMEGPIGSWVTGKALGTTASTDMLDMMGPFNVVPFAGIGFAY